MTHDLTHARDLLDRLAQTTGALHHLAVEEPSTLIDELSGEMNDIDDRRARRMASELDDLADEVRHIEEDAAELLQRFRRLGVEEVVAELEDHAHGD